MGGLIAVLALWAAAPAAAEGRRFDVFSDSARVFALPIADPRRIGISASYYRLDGKDTADVALGHTWNLFRWGTSDGRWQFASDVAGMAYSRFLLGGSINSFETVDFNIDLPVSARWGPFSGRASLFHQSSHLGDDYIRRTGDLGFHYSKEGLRGLLALELFSVLRLYGGGTLVLNGVPIQSGGPQGGAELMGPDLKLSGDYPVRPYAAADFQAIDSTGYALSTRVVAGLELSNKRSRKKVRAYGGWFHGFSPYGQFFNRREEWVDVSLSLHL